jgi:anthranilate phosphoribosyltransferase
VGELKNGEISEYEIHPEDFGLPMASNRALKVETPEQSRAMLHGRAGQPARRGARHRHAQRRCGAVRRQRGGHACRTASKRPAPHRIGRRQGRLAQFVAATQTLAG